MELSTPRRSQWGETAAPVTSLLENSEELLRPRDSSSGSIGSKKKPSTGSVAVVGVAGGGADASPAWPPGLGLPRDGDAESKNPRSASATDALARTEYYSLVMDSMSAAYRNVSSAAVLLRPPRDTHVGAEVGAPTGLGGFPPEQSAATSAWGTFAEDALLSRSPTAVGSQRGGSSSSVQSHLGALPPTLPTRASSRDSASSAATALSPAHGLPVASYNLHSEVGPGGTHVPASSWTQLQSEESLLAWQQQQEQLQLQFEQQFSAWSASPALPSAAAAYGAPAAYSAPGHNAPAAHRSSFPPGAAGMPPPPHYPGYGDAVAVGGPQWEAALGGYLGPAPPAAAAPGWYYGLPPPMPWAGGPADTFPPRQQRLEQQYRNSPQPRFGARAHAGAPRDYPPYAAAGGAGWHADVQHNPAYFPDSHYGAPRWNGEADAFIGGGMSRDGGYSPYHGSRSGARPPRAQSNLQRDGFRDEPAAVQQQFRGPRHSPDNALQSRFSVPASGWSGLPSIAEIRAFHLAQWSLLRALVVRRAHAASPPGSAGLMPTALTSDAVRAAMDALRVPRFVSELVSRPDRHGHRHNQPPVGARAGERLDSPELSMLSEISYRDIYGAPDFDVSVTEGQPAASDSEVRAALDPSLTESALAWTPAASSVGSRPAVANSEDAAAAVAAVPRTQGDPALLLRITVSALEALVADLVARRRWKTKPCHAFQRTGSCSRGANCDYAHGDEQLRVLDTPRDARWKTRLCRVWLDSCGAFCPHDARCAFAHGVKDLRVHVRSVNGAEPVTAKPASEQEHGFDRHSGGGPSVLGHGQRFKHYICRQWLQGAAAAYAQRAVDEVASGDTQSSTPPAPRGDGSCPRGDDCEFSHGIGDLRLPTQTEIDSMIQSLASEPAHASIRMEAPVGDALSMRLQMLLLLGSGLIPISCVANESIAVRVAAAISARSSATRVLHDGISLPEFSCFPSPLGAALTAAVFNPLLQVVLSNAAPGDVPSRWPSGFSLAKIVSDVGCDAADVSLFTAAVALGIVSADVRLPVVTGDGLAGSAPAASSSSSFSGLHVDEKPQRRPGNGGGNAGRYGTMLRRREELQRLIRDTSRVLATGAEVAAAPPVVTAA